MQVILVCGPPASGKTTYVRNNMVPGDMVVDLDAIMQAISFQEQRTNATKDLLPVALELRKYLYRIIDEHRVHAFRCWIIECLPKQEDRDDLQERFCAEVVEMQASYRECIDRAMRDPQRKDKREQLYAIEKYFKRKNNETKK